MNIVMVELYRQGKPKNLEKTCPCANFSTIDPSWTDQGVNPGLSADKPAPNHLCQGKVYKGFIPKPIYKLQLYPEDDRHCQQVIKLQTTD
jgi:hypothetical protein